MTETICSAAELRESNRRFWQFPFRLRRPQSAASGGRLALDLRAMQQPSSCGIESISAMHHAAVVPD